MLQVLSLIEFISNFWRKKKKAAETRDCSEFIRTLRFWTRDLQIFSLTLSQLSYLGCWNFNGNFCINISIINNIVLTASAPYFASLWYNEQKWRFRHYNRTGWKTTKTGMRDSLFGEHNSKRKVGKLGIITHVISIDLTWRLPNNECGDQENLTKTGEICKDIASFMTWMRKYEPCFFISAQIDYFISHTSVFALVFPLSHRSSSATLRTGMFRSCMVIYLYNLLGNISCHFNFTTT